MSGTWTLRGVSTETKDAFSRAARLSNLTIGQLADRVLMCEAQKIINESSSTDFSGVITEMQKRLDAIENELKLASCLEESPNTQETFER